MVEQQPDKKRDVTLSVGKMALAGTIIAALIAAATTITVTLLQRENSSPPTPTPSTVASWPFAQRKVFDEYALEGDNGVRKVLIDDYGVQPEEIQDVDCPANEEVKAGNKFICIVRMGKDKPADKTVDITVVDDNGEYQVGIPRG